jgi:hypothetical protein
MATNLVEFKAGKNLNKQKFDQSSFSPILSVDRSAR